MSEGRPGRTDWEDWLGGLAGEGHGRKACARVMEVESTCGGSGEDQSGRVRESLRLRREECAACGALEPEARGRLSACLGKASGKRDWRRCQANVLGEPFRVPGCPVPLPGRCREQDFEAVLQLWTQAASAGSPVRSWGVQVVLSWQPWMSPGSTGSLDAVSLYMGVGAVPWSGETGMERLCTGWRSGRLLRTLVCREAGAGPAWRKAGY